LGGQESGFLHSVNGDAPYQPSTDAMSHWPEIETAVGAKLNKNGAVEICAPFGVGSLMQGKVTPNPKRSRALV
jgi:hypothetical protein